MREILFRGKAVHSGEWVEGYLFSYGTGTDFEETCILGELDHRESVYEIWKCAEIVDPKTVGQWTGLLDKNGKKIFEGDIVRVEYHQPIINGIYKIGYSDIGWCLERNPAAHLRSFFTFSNLNYFWEISEVIGNIHDNPKFMEGRV